MVVYCLNQHQSSKYNNITLQFRKDACVLSTHIQRANTDFFSRIFQILRLTHSNHHDFLTSILKQNNYRKGTRGVGTYQH